MKLLLTYLTPLLILMTMADLLPAQVKLDRISAVERSDGNGYVVRYHLNTMVDSFKVIQPAEDLIQMVLYAEDIDTTGISFPPKTDIFKSIDLYKTSTGYGIDISLGPETFFLTEVYPDQNKKDLLLALTYTGYSEIASLTEGIEPVTWSVYGADTLDFFVDEPVNADLFSTGDLQFGNNMQFDVIVLDAGHGGHDPGTIGHKGLNEKDLTLEITKRVGAYLNEHLPDVKVVYTREDDTFISLLDRGRIANEAGGDIFVSIHANSFSQRRVNGAEVYFLGLARSQSALEVMKRENSVLEYEDREVEKLTEEDLLIYELANAGNMSTSEIIAGQIEQQFRERASRPSRGVKQAAFQVLYEASMPGVLIEIGFISNPDEARYLSSDYGQSIIASAIFRSIRDFKVQYDRSLDREPAAATTAN
jgi:N-acetylmuramoyl-L-alanine amidase